MRKTHIWIGTGSCIAGLALVVWAQGPKAGLYQVVSTTTWQQSPFPAGMAPGGQGPRTSQVCITQEQLDKYNGLPPQTRGDCQLSNVVKKADGYSADVACSGQMSSKGTVEGSYSADGHGKTKLHLLGSFQRGASSVPVEMTVESHSTYKGPDCGNVKPESPGQ